MRSERSETTVGSMVAAISSARCLATRPTAAPEMADQREHRCRGSLLLISGAAMMSDQYDEPATTGLCRPFGDKAVLPIPRLRDRSPNHDRSGHSRRCAAALGSSRILSSARPPAEVAWKTLVPPTRGERHEHIPRA